MDDSSGKGISRFQIQSLARSRMTIDEQLRSANIEYLRSGAVFSNIIQKMEADLQRMKDKKLQQEFIDDKDHQIQELVIFFNQVDELVQLYKLLNLNLKMQLTEACTYIVKTSQDDKVQQEYLMKYINTITQRKPTHG